MISRMCKIEVVGTKKLLARVLEKIQALGVLHVEEVPLLSPRPGRFELRRIPLTSAEEEEKKLLEQAADNLDEVARLMPVKIKEVIAMTLAGGPKMTLDKIVEESKKYLEEASKRHRQHTELLDELRILENYRALLESIGALVLVSAKQQNYRYLGITVAKEEKAVLRILEEELGKLTQKTSQIYKGGEDQKQVAALIGFPPQYEQAVKDFIWNKGISEIKLPSAFRDKPLQEALRGLKDRIAEVPAEIEKATRAIAAYFQQNGREILTLRGWSHTQLRRLEVVENLAQSHYTFVVVGWMPEKRLQEFRAALQEEFRDEVVVNRLVPSRRDYGKVPVALENPRAMRPFELLIKLFPPPLYGTMDVTLLIGIVFPIFFGYILGDVGYGLMMGGLALYFRKLWRHKPVMKQVLTILYACTASSILFGFLFGEFLGDLGHKWLGMKPILFNREVDIVTSLIIAVGIGVAHVLLGISLGLYLAWKSGDRHGVWANGAFLGSVVAVLVLLLAVTGVLPPLCKTYAAWALGVLLPLLIYLHGAMAPLEIISVLGNMLSYARLMAIGLASVILASVANKFVTLCGSLALGLAMAVFLHTLNFCLGVFAPTVQSLRLHYVEFFMKFYRPEGRMYQPFAIIR